MALNKSFQEYLGAAIICLTLVGASWSLGNQ